MASASQVAIKSFEKRPWSFFWRGGCCMKYHQLNTLFYVSLQLIVKQCLNPLIRVKRAFVFLL